MFWLGLEIFCIGLIVWLISRANIRAKASLRNWIDRHGYTLLNADRRIIRKGPYLWASSGQVVFRVTLLDSNQNSHMAWVKCGSYWKGAAFSDDVEGMLDGLPRQ